MYINKEEYRSQDPLNPRRTTAVFIIDSHSSWTISQPEKALARVMDDKQLLDEDALVNECSDERIVVVIKSWLVRFCWWV